MAWAEWLGGRRARLRTGFLLVVVLGVILPLTVLASFLALSAQRSAEALVRSRVERSLAAAVQGTGSNWAHHRGTVLSLAESDAVQDALGHGQSVHSVPGWSAGALDRDPVATGLWATLEGVVQRAVLRDATGAVVGVLEREGPVRPVTEPPMVAALVPFRVTVHRSATGQPIGTLEAWLRAGELLPLDALGPGVTGSILAIFDPDDGSPLLPLAMEPSLFAQKRFRWSDESWTVVHHRMYDPPLILAMAAPVGDFVGPFQAAARQGLIVLFIVAMAAVALTFLASRRLTRSLAELAEAATDVAAGQLDRRATEQGPDEVYRLACAFNAMTTSLRATLRRLSQRESVAAVGELAASVAHEVRNPLTAVRLSLERAGEELSQGHAADPWVRRALRDVERLDGSVGDLLHLARSGNVDLNPVRLAEPLRDAMAAASPRFADHGGILEPPAAADLETLVLGDEDALEQLFLNLLLNAADAAAPGDRAGVRVHCREEWARVEVWDQGPGIPPEVRGRVLEPFFSTKPDGTGLGLAIAHRIAMAHGGDLEVASEPGLGTTITVTLRRALAVRVVAASTERSVVPAAAGS
jgi:signal transduction histidine kinase